MGILIRNNIINQKGNPAWYEDTLAARPIANLQGRMFVDTDNPSTGIYRDTGSTWVNVADPGAGTTGTLQQVTTNGSSTNVGISVSANGIGIGTTIPGANILDIHGTTGVLAQLENTTTQNSLLSFRNQGAGVWSIGNGYNAGANDFIVYDATNFLNRLTIKNNGIASLTGLLNISSRLNVNGATDNSQYQLNVIGNTLITGDIINNELHGGVIQLQTNGNSTALLSNLYHISGSGTESDFNTYVYGNNQYGIWTNGTQRFSITGLGLVNFISNGTATTFAVNINSIANTADTNLPSQLMISSQAAYNANPTSGIMFQNAYNNAGTLGGMGGICVRKENATNGDYASTLELSTRANGGNIIPQLKIESTGNTIFSSSIAINNTLSVSVAAPSTHKVAIKIGGVQYYLLASNV